MGHNSRNKFFSEIAHDGGHFLSATTASSLLSLAGLSLSISWVLGTLVLAGLVEGLYPSGQVPFQSGDDWKDFGTYQLSWVVFLGLTGNWMGALVVLLIVVPLLVAYYTREFS